MNYFGFGGADNVQDSELFFKDPDIERRFFIRQEICKRGMSAEVVQDRELYEFAKKIGLDADEVEALGIIDEIDEIDKQQIVSKILSIVSKNEEERIVLGIVLEPDTVDAQNETIAADEIASSAHGWLSSSQHVGLMHTELADKEVEVYESYTAPVDFEINDFKIKQGTWLVMLHVVNDTMWDAIREGKINGFSVGGYGHREPV